MFEKIKKFFAKKEKKPTSIFNIGESANDRLVLVGGTIFFSKNEEAKKEWIIIQDEIFNRFGLYKLPRNEMGWYCVPFEEQIAALHKGNLIIEKYGL